MTSDPPTEPTDIDTGTVVDTDTTPETAATAETGAVATGPAGAPDATGDTGAGGSTGDTVPPLPETMWVLGTYDGTERACVVALEPDTLARHDVYCMPDGEDALPAEVWRTSGVQQVDGSRLLALVLRLELLGVSCGTSTPSPATRSS